MSDCPRGDMRDLLPDLLNERLDASARADVARHVASCAECAAELELLRSMRSALSPAPRVDVARIAAAVAASVAASRGAGASSPNVRPLAVRRESPPHRRIAWRIAAGFVVAALGVTTWVLAHRATPEPTSTVAAAPAHVDSGPPAPRMAATPHPAATTTPPNAPQILASTGRHGLVMDGGVNDLSDGDVKVLLQSLDSLTAIPDADPAPMTYQIDDDGGVQ